MSTVTVDTTELAAALAAALDAALDARAAAPRLYTAEQVSKLTEKAVEPRWLERRALEEVIPVRRVGRCLRWTVEDIHAAYACWLQEPTNARKR